MYLVQFASPEVSGLDGGVWGAGLAWFGYPSFLDMEKTWDLQFRDLNLNPSNSASEL